MSSASQDPLKGTFFYLVGDIRMMIYSYLVIAKRNRTPKDARACSRSITFYQWNLHPVIFRLNQQIREEAKRVMASNNKFVVFEWVQGLVHSGPSTRPDDSLRPWEANMKPTVPGEKMRVTFYGPQVQETDTSTYVILAEELWDVCAVGLPMSQAERVLCDIADICCLIKVHPPSPDSKETPEARDVRERAMLEPLPHLRYTQNVSIEGTQPGIKNQVISHFRRSFIDRGLVFVTFSHLITNGDLASSAGDYDIATAYYRRANNYLLYCDCNHLSRSRDVAGGLTELNCFKYVLLGGFASYLKVKQRCALNWIRAGNFSKALEAAQNAISSINHPRILVFPMLRGLPIDSNGFVLNGSTWNLIWQHIEEGCITFRKAFRTEHIGRCYYYKYITGRMIFGDINLEFVQPNRVEASRYCDVSRAMTKDVLVELGELEIQTMKKYPPGPRTERQIANAWVFHGNSQITWGHTIDLRVDILGRYHSIK